jgi:Protein of unknown function (DUF1592)/Protein of unknown function (DUF1588)/Protein of unknown function (DUF1585)
LRAFRRPLTDTERTTKLEAYRRARSTWKATHAEALDQLTTLFLISPELLYHLEVPDNFAPAKMGAWMALSDYELASRLSYALWKSMPDEQLLQAASSGVLQTQSGIWAQAERMLADSRYERAIERFVSQWAGLDQIDSIQKDPKKFPAFTTQLAQDMKTEGRLFARHALNGVDANFKTLLTANFSFINARLAKLYGVSNGPQGDAFERVTLDASQRAGLFTQGAFLASHALPNGNSPPRRGKYLADQVLCASVSPPSGDIVIVVPPPTPGATTRMLFTEATAPANCKGCHNVLNPVGFSFELYDSTGAIQTQEEGKPIDASGAFEGSSFSGAPQLLQQAVARPDTANCITENLFRFFVGRRPSDAEATTVEALSKELTDEELKTRNLIAYLVQSNSFRFRTKNSGE